MVHPEHLIGLRSRLRRAAIAISIVLVHGLGLYLIVHHSVHLIKLESDRTSGGSVQVRLVAAPTPHPTAKPTVQPERPPEPEPRLVEKPMVKPTVRKAAPVLSSEAPAARTVELAPTEPVKPVETVQPARVTAPSAATPPAPAQPAPDLLASPKEISSAELKQLGCRIPRPDYPPKARRLEQEGTVVVKLTIGVDGAVKAARLAQSSGYPLLDAAALASIEAGHCQPYTTAGIPRAVEAVQPVAFNLND